MLKAFDHVNVRTANLDAMIAWYGTLLGLHPWRRPNFSFPGAWLYLGEQALIHLVGQEQQPAGGDPTLEHFAFSATGLKEFTARAAEMGVAIDWYEVPGFGILQANIHDPDGNHIHVDFAVAERDA